MSKIEKIRDFIATCPYLENNKINVSYLERNYYSYSIEKTPNEIFLQRFVDGGGKKQITFDFVVKLPITSRLIDNLANSQFGEDFVNWIEKQEEIRNLPQIEGAFSIGCLSPEYILQRTETEAIYLIQMNFTYYELSKTGSSI